MNIDPQAIADLVQLNGGRIVGKTRLQKTFYFLEACDLGLGLDFQYYHYGPYSEDLSLAVDDAVALDVLSIDWKAGTNAPYAVFSVTSPNTIVSSSNDDGRKKILSVLEKYDSISLELAATADFLSRVGYESDPWSETKIRKSTKATDEKVERAKRLLSDLGNLKAA
ncbi:hypothetical protein [Rhizobium leguminosarum]|uniref:hypothetical protein n=1 Tax=Rhizobium leguminosarum TaxID=384 RepID=UPI001C93FF53|nr:hypothetical protein [Rhizobium leguminosarum]MBY5798190.1 hypothetical protein [Rhizobium leguminosarum]